MQEEAIQKLVTWRGFFKNQLLAAKDLLWSKNTMNSVQVNKATDVHHDHRPTRSSQVSKMCQDMDKIQTTQGTECCRSLLLYFPFVYKYAIFPWRWLLINKQTYVNKKYNLCATIYCSASLTSSIPPCPAAAAAGLSNTPETLPPELLLFPPT